MPVFVLVVSLAAFAGETFGAETVADRSTSMQLSQVRLVELARLVYSELLREDYIFDAAFLAEPSEVTVDVRGIDPEQARRLVVDTAEAAGFVVERIGKVWRFGRARIKAAEEPELFFYRPKNRSVAYLADLLATLFPAGSFSFQKGVAQAPASNVAPVGGIAGMQQGQVVPGRALPSTAAGSFSAMAGGPYFPGVGQVTGSGASVIDPKIDAFIFKGKVADVERLAKLLGQVDVAVGELLVRAVVYEVRRSATDTSAVALAFQVLGGQIGLQLGSMPAGANSLSVAVGGFKAVVAAFATDARFKAVSSPSLRVQSGQVAKFTVGDETPVLGSVATTQSGATVQSVDYRPSGVILELKPFARENVVDLDVRQQLSSFAVTTSGVNNSPTLLKRELQTVVGVRPGETIVLGGLEDSRLAEDRTGLSFLPRWLDAKGKQDDKTEILLVLDVQRIGG
jgi:hypothetical protein